MPQGIKITDNAIIPLKERVVDGSNGRLAWLGVTIRRRIAGARQAGDPP